MCVCNWFKCGAKFTRSRVDQKFCSTACQGADANWRAMRGKAVVPLLLIWRKSRHWTREERKQWEIDNGQPVPNISDIARMADSWAAELRGQS